MHVREVSPVRWSVGRLATDEDWRDQLEGLAADANIHAGWFVGLGPVRSPELWYDDQSAGRYEPIALDDPMEAAACVGNISLLDGEPFAHTHAVLSDPEGRPIDGHQHAAEVFAGGVCLVAFDAALERSHDSMTGLDAWDLQDGR